MHPTTEQLATLAMLGFDEREGWTSAGTSETKCYSRPMHTPVTLRIYGPYSDGTWLITPNVSTPVAPGLNRRLAHGKDTGTLDELIVLVTELDKEFGYAVR